MGAQNLGIPDSDMGTVHKALVGFVIAGAASSVLAFESRTLTFDVPDKVSYPPTFPPTDLTPAGTWNTVTGAGSLGITSPGLQVPKLNDVFTLFSVPAELQGSLFAIDITVQGYAHLTYEVDNDGASAIVNGSVNLVSDLKVYAPTDTAPVSFPTGTLDLTVVLDKSVTINLDANDGDAAFPILNVGGGDYTSGTTDVQNSGTRTYVSGDAPFAFFSGSGVAYIPIGFTGSSSTSGGGNVSFDGTTFGAALVTVTYTFVPESDLAWAGLPLVVGGWLIRRRMVAGKKA